MTAACYHCGLPVDGAGWRATVLGEERRFCCAGCRAVAEAIVAGGAETYYATRTAAGMRPQAGVAPSLYDDPQAQAQFAWAAGPHESGATLILEGIRCAACLWLNERTLRGVPGVVRAQVNYATRRAEVVWDSRRTRLSVIIGALRAVGYDAWPWDPERQDALDRKEARAALWRLFVAGFGAMQVMMYAFPAYIDEGAGTLSRESESLLRLASLLLTLPVIVFSCGPFFSGAWRELKRLRPGMDTPIALGVGAGFLASAWATLAGAGAVYFDSISMLVFLLLAARTLELSARRRAARSLDRLARWSPDFALRLDGGNPVRIAAHELAPGDRALVAPGERVPADGVVESGRSALDESLLTGESLPVAKQAGDALIAGSINRDQPLVLRVERAGANTRAAGLARLVERAAASRPRLVATADRLAHAMTWIVLAVAAVAGFLRNDVWIAIAVLVATCPCALALAAPIALTSASGVLAARGVALTRASALETFERATDVILDKTGTLTTGRFRIAEVRVLGRCLEDECRALAGALEASSRHPIARAFEGRAHPLASETRNAPGRGVEATVGGRRLRLGTESYCGELCGNSAGELDIAEGCTPVFLADEGGFLALFLLEDSPRAEASAAVAALRTAGLRLHLVSGDRPDAVNAAARSLGIEDRTAGANPQAKLDYIDDLQGEGRIVAMVGDGLNDAPVLAQADVSFAMGGGADAAQARSDAVLLSNSLTAVPATLALARRTMRIVRQNFAWALGYNALALPLAAFGFIGPWEAAVGMAASSFIVVLNALRVEAGVPQVDLHQKETERPVMQSFGTH